MKYPVRSLLCVLLCLALAATLCACGGESGYRVVDTYSQQGSYVIAYREGDHLGEYVTAALKVLAANGTLKTTSYAWFGENLIAVRGDNDALDEYRQDITARTVTVGVDINNMPLSYQEGDSYKGFDVDLANYICGALGWSMVIYPIDPQNVDVELASGNIDMAMGVSESSLPDGTEGTPAYLNSRYVLVARVRGNVSSKSALYGKTLGVTVSDMDILETDEKFVENLGSIIYQTNTESLFDALLSGEVDGVLVSSVVAAYYMNIET